MKQLSSWLNVNKIALNVAKTGVILFKTKHELCDTELRLKLYRKIFTKMNHVSYLGIIIDENLNWKTHVHYLASKLNRANSVLSKLRHFVSSEILRHVYFAIFQPHVNYVVATWGLTNYPNLKVSILKKSIKIISFMPFNAHSSPLLKICNTLRFCWYCKCWMLYICEQLLQ